MAEFAQVTSFIESLHDLTRGEGASDKDVSEITKRWGLIPSDYEKFLRTYGWLTFDAVEIPGLGEAIPPHLDLIARAQTLWNSGVPKELLPIYDSYGDWLYCLLHKADDVCVVVYSLEDDGKNMEEFPSWSDWFLSMFGELN